MFKTAIFVALAMTAFAANSIFTRLAIGAGQIDAAGFSGVRLLSGAIALVILLLVTGRAVPLAANLTNRTRWTTAMALLIYAVPFSFSYVLLGAGTGALILFATVQLSMFAWAVFKGDRPAPLAMLGMAIALCASAYLVSPGLTAPDPLGAALMVTAGIAWAVYSLLGRGSTEPLTDTALNFVFLVPVAILLCAISLRAATPQAAGIFWAIASGALASGIGYAIWYRALPHLTRTRAAAVQLSVPVIAAAGGILFIGEALTFRLAISSVLILGGLALAIAASGKR
jgi:drug/metabolite transporter (DMT)-like permease